MGTPHKRRFPDPKGIKGDFKGPAGKRKHVDASQQETTTRTTVRREDPFKAQPKKPTPKGVTVTGDGFTLDW